MARLPHLRAMESFEAVARLGSVSAAAGELGVSPGAVSQQVRRLEAHLGVTLVERRGRHLELTRWGRLYHAEIEGAFAQLLAAERPMRAALGGAPLVVSGLPTVAAKWLGRALYDRAREVPDVPVRLVSEEADAAGSGEAWDFRMDFGPPPADGPGAELFTDVAVPACAPSLLEGRPISTPEDLLVLPRLRIGPLGGEDGSCKCPSCNAPLFFGETKTKCCLFRDSGERAEWCGPYVASIRT